MSVGEFEFIERVKAQLGQNREGIEGIGDDGVWLRSGDGRIIAMDTMVEHVHFRLDWSSPSQIAYKLFASNFSDIWAMGAKPSVGLLSLSLPSSLAQNDSFQQRWLSGAVEACERLAPGFALVGGDTTASRDHLVMTLTVLGQLQGSQPIRRSGAKVGESVWVDGPLGWAAAGLEILESKLLNGEPLNDELRCFRRAHTRTTLDGPAVYTALEGVSAAIDISDGLLADAGHLARASGVSLELDIDVLPGRSRLSAHFSREKTDEFQLVGGDDYVRLATAQEQPGPHFVRIGRVRGRAEQELIVSGVSSALLTSDGGFRHF